jgi:hypothetical protein
MRMMRMLGVQALDRIWQGFQSVESEALLPETKMILLVNLLYLGVGIVGRRGFYLSAAPFS